jgi:hypothetical protein
MKVAGAIAGLLIASMVAWFVFGHKSAPSSNLSAGTQERADAKQDSSFSTAIPKPDRPLNAPQTKEEQVREEFARKRLPFYKFLRDNYSAVIRNFAITESIDTLDLEVTKSDSDTLSNIISNAVSPTAKEYGFRKVRFYVANPPNSVQPVTLVAESTYDDAGRWNTFMK